MKYLPLKLYLKIFVYICLFATLLIYAQRLISHPYYGSDFRSYYAAAQIVRHEPQQLYNLTTQQHYQDIITPTHLRGQILPRLLPYVNPPFYLLSYLPLTYTSPAIAYQTTIVFNLLLFSLCLILLYRLSHYRSRLLFILFGLSFAPLYTTLFQNSNSVVSLFLFILIYQLLTKQRWLLVGIISSLLIYKVQLALVLLLYLFSLKEKPIVFGFIIGLSLLVLISAYLLHGNLQSYFDIFTWYALDHDNYIHSNLNLISLQGLFAQVSFFVIDFPHRWPAVSLSLIFIAVALYLIHTLPKQNNNLNYSFSLIIVSTLISGLHIHQYESLLLLLPLAFYFNYLNRPGYLLVAGGWIILLLSYFSPIYPYSFPFLPAIYLIALYVLLIKHRYRLRP